MRVALRALSSCRTDQHGPPGEQGLGVTTAPGPGGELHVFVTWRLPMALAASYRDVGEAVALLVELPGDGVVASACLVDRELQRPGRGPSWRGPPAEPSPPGALCGGWVTAGVRLVGSDRPVTAYVRAVLRERTSAACRVELLPAAEEDR